MIYLENETYLLGKLFREAELYAYEKRHEFLAPEHLLLSIVNHPFFKPVLKEFDIQSMIEDYISNFFEKVPNFIEYSIEDLSLSEGLQKVLITADSISKNDKIEMLSVYSIIRAMTELENPFLMIIISEVYNGVTKNFLKDVLNCSRAELLEMVGVRDGYEGNDEDLDEIEEDDMEDISSKDWKQFVSCVNEKVDLHNPLIGREFELERTIQILCRKEKNNPLHIGEPGVGKTAIVYGLAMLINENKVPDCLKNSKIFSVDMGTLIAGTQFRGEFEKRLKNVLEGVKEEKNAILYIDEIHTIVGAGRTDKGSLDASNILKPYLESGEIRFMGATTYEEYNKNFINDKALSRRFEQVSIPEPTIPECVKILNGIKKRFEDFHKVIYTEDAINFAASASAKYITGKFLPDKAVDLLDEAGAWLQIHPTMEAVQVVDKKLISEVLSKICKVDILAEDKDEMSKLIDLEERIKKQVFGQDKAVLEVTEAVQMASTGLVDDNKPMASLLFVGPTGVGKTEMARVLASEMGVPLIRFDMSEYVEKHSVAKLIGSPAGYVGYENGGLLTDAVRKSPHCVLLLDELEKAHQDIYNILLQVMDYAVLTDNKGQKTDFRHAIIIMTTNAGAQYAKQMVGFVKGKTVGEAMMKSVKSTFKPEFLNRLTAVTIFNEMSREMAEKILHKRLGFLREKLEAKKVTLKLSNEAVDYILNEGFSPEYGGREIDRVINNQLKPLLMRGLLHGTIKEGQAIVVTMYENKLTINSHVNI